MRISYSAASLLFEAQRMLEESVLLDELIEANTGEILSEMISLWNEGKLPLKNEIG